MKSFWLYIHIITQKVLFCQGIGLISVMYKVSIARRGKWYRVCIWIIPFFCLVINGTWGICIHRINIGWGCICVIPNQNKPATITLYFVAIWIIVICADTTDRATNAHQIIWDVVFSPHYQSWFWGGARHAHWDVVINICNPTFTARTIGAHLGVSPNIFVAVTTIG